MTDACKDCRFWDEIFPEVGEQPSHKGDCNRYPPQLCVVAENSVKQLVPRTPETFRCGEFEREEVPLAPVRRDETMEETTVG